MSTKGSLTHMLVAWFTPTTKASEPPRAQRAGQACAAAGCQPGLMDAVPPFLHGLVSSVLCTVSKSWMAAHSSALPSSYSAWTGTGRSEKSSGSVLSEDLAKPLKTGKPEGAEVPAEVFSCISASLAFQQLLFCCVKHKDGVTLFPSFSCLLQILLGMRLPPLPLRSEHRLFGCGYQMYVGHHLQGTCACNNDNNQQ